TTDWMSWIHLENLSAYHDRAFADQRNGFEGLERVWSGEITAETALDNAVIQGICYSNSSGLSAVNRPSQDGNEVFADLI
nr:hypothetical protein [Gammaproteobacteria bacterium]